MNPNLNNDIELSKITIDDDFMNAVLNTTKPKKSKTNKSLKPTAKYKDNDE